MLNLLAKVTTTTVPSSSQTPINIDDDRLSFWYKQILPLLFDDNIAIQDSAIVAIKSLLPHLDVINYENHSDWETTKNIILEK